MTIRIIEGDCRVILPTLPAQSVHCCVTSPPYFGLRDYGTATWKGGDDGCDHFARLGRNDADFNERTQEQYGKHSGTMRVPAGVQFAGSCGKCGATRTDSQIGLEANPAEYVSELVAVFREVRRVLWDDGTVWLNLGDSYAGGGQNSGSKPEDLTEKQRSNGGCRYERTPIPRGLKAKDLIGIPWRVAFALQADGWYLRQDIIWSKPNPMPESVQDRCTKAHEYLFLLSKSPTYHCDMAAIAETAIGAPGGNIKPNASFVDDPIKHRTKAGLAAAQQRARDAGGFETRNKRSVWTVATQPFKEAHFATFPPDLIEPCILAGCPEFTCGACGTALDSRYGKHSVRTDGKALAPLQMVRGEGDAGSTKPRAELLQQGLRLSVHGEAPLDDDGALHHVEGIRLDLSTGAPERDKGRLHHGAPSRHGANAWATALGDGSGTSQGREPAEQRAAEFGDADEARSRQVAEDQDRLDPLPALRAEDSDFSACPRCKASLDEVGIGRGSVLDCFGGAGTTGLVADRLQRDAVLIELNPTYAAMARTRVASDAPLFAEVT